MINIGLLVKKNGFNDTMKKMLEKRPEIPLLPTGPMPAGAINTEGRTQECSEQSPDRIKRREGSLAMAGTLVEDVSLTESGVKTGLCAPFEVEFANDMHTSSAALSIAQSSITGSTMLSSTSIVDEIIVNDTMNGKW